MARKLTPGLMATTRWGEVVRICAIDSESVVVETDAGLREIAHGDIASVYEVEPCRGADDGYLRNLIQGNTIDWEGDDE